MSKHDGGFYCLNCLHLWEKETWITECENKYFSKVFMPSEDTKMLEFNQYRKSGKVPFIIYADLESLIEKIDVCENNG